MKTNSFRSSQRCFPGFCREIKTTTLLLGDSNSAQGGATGGKQDAPNQAPGRGERESLGGLCCDVRVALAHLSHPSYVLFALYM